MDPRAIGDALAGIAEFFKSLREEGKKGKKEEDPLHEIKYRIGDTVLKRSIEASCSSESTSSHSTGG